MPDRFLYLAIDLGVIAAPLLFSFHPRIRFYKHWPAFFLACAVTLVPFIIWDIAFTDADIWGFNARYLTGKYIANLPVEEWLFFICIPYACTFTFYSLGFVKQKIRLPALYPILTITGIAFLIVAMIFWNRAYTCLSFGLAGLVLTSLASIQKSQWLPRAIFTFLLIQPFFFLSNGLLTGSWISDEVVWYNGVENLGIRMGTIPIEDISYGFLLVMLNILLFETWRGKNLSVT